MVGYRNALRAAAGDANGEGNRGVLGIKRVCESGWRRISVSCGDQSRPSGPAGTTENSPALKCWAIVVRPLGWGWKPAGARWWESDFRPDDPASGHSSGRSGSMPGGNSSQPSKWFGRSGSEMACSSANHLPRSTSLHRREQNGPNGVANQSPDFLHVGHLLEVGPLILTSRVPARLDQPPARKNVGEFHTRCSV